jgi:U3 small nucleolar RNA-associated protein 19
VIQNEGRPLPETSNLMNQLVPLTNLPKVKADLNTFFIPTLSEPPASQSGPSESAKKTKKSKKGKDKEVDATPDWMAFYESGSEGEDDDEPVKAGTKRRVRTSHMSIHASVHSIPSHQTVYTSLWETVLGQVTLEDLWIRKILVGLHGDKGILSNMKAERRVRFTDWLGSLIDGGGANAMLAMNGLYVLMTQYNLYVIFAVGPETHTDN